MALRMDRLSDSQQVLSHRKKLKGVGEGEKRAKLKMTRACSIEASQLPCLAVSLININQSLVSLIILALSGKFVPTRTGRPRWRQILLAPQESSSVSAQVMKQNSYFEVL